MNKYYNLSTALLVYLISVGVLFILSTKSSQSLIYTLDDAYIHMAIAKHFVESGVWGITQYNFSSTTSSPLWTFLLSLDYFLLGANTHAPFYLNLLFGCLSIITLYYILRAYTLTEKQILIFIIIFIFTAPLPALTYIGMEHLMQILLVLLFSFYSVKVLTFPTTKYIYLLAIISPLMLMTRYEMASLIIVAAGLLLLQKRIKYSILILIISFLPLSLYGMLSVKNGSYFLPNSILAKTGAAVFNPDVAGLLKSKLATFQNQMLILLLILVPVFFGLGYIKIKNYLEKEKQNLLLLFLIIAIIHLPMIKIGSFFRYEAYLVVLLILNIALNYSSLAAAEFRNKKIILVLVALIIFLPLGLRAFNSYIHTPKASMNIFQQQYQMGLFIRQYYNSDNIILNDIGLVNYFSDIKLTDLCGLGDNDIISLENNKNINSLKEVINKHNGKVAIIYDKWFPGLGEDWIKIEEWTIPDNVICGDDKVSIYAIKSAEKENLTRNLIEFNQRLPAGVRYTLR